MGKVKASALYLVVVICLAIAIACASLIAVAYFYKITSLKKSRHDLLWDNLGSGVNLLLATADTAFANGAVVSLFNGSADTVYLKKMQWGVYTVGVAKSFIQSDTLFRSFMIAGGIDSTKWCALYLADNERVVSVSGKTMIRGDAYISRAGVQTAFMNNTAYTGNKQLIIGARLPSAKAIPALSSNALRLMENFYDSTPSSADSTLKLDSVSRSFMQSTKFYNFEKKKAVLRNIYLSGNIIIRSDTTLFIDSTARLENVIVLAKAVVVGHGFRGKCQLFGRDSVSLGQNVRLDYPSCIGVMRFDGATTGVEQISLGNNTTVSGVAFTYDGSQTQLPPVIRAAKKSMVTGQIYSQGITVLADDFKVEGSVFSKMFYYNGPGVVYGNFIVNTTIDEKALSRFYLSCALMPVTNEKRKVLQWLESN